MRTMTAALLLAAGAISITNAAEPASDRPLDPSTVAASSDRGRCHFSRSIYVAQNGLVDATEEYQFLVSVRDFRVLAKKKFGGGCIRITFSAQVLGRDLGDVGGEPRTYIQALVNGSADSVVPNPATDGQVFATGVQSSTHTMVWTARAAGINNVVEVGFRTGELGHQSLLMNAHLVVEY